MSKVVKFVRLNTDFEILNPLRTVNVYTTDKIEFGEHSKSSILNYLLLVKREIRITTEDLIPWLLNNQESYEALKRFVLEHHKNTIKILIKNPKSLIDSEHILLELQRKILGQIEFRVLKDKRFELKENTILIDNLHKIDVDLTKRRSTILVEHPKHLMFALIEEFEDIWQTSSTSVELRDMLI